MDRDGGAATFTGTGCSDWAGGRTGDGYAVQGNLLTGEEAGRRGSPGPAVRRPAGGHPGGRYGGGSDVYADLRVDDSPDPVPELERLLGLHDLFFGRPDPAGLRPLSGELLDEARGLMVQAGHPPAAADAMSVRAALWKWAGVENLEGRILAEPVLDSVVLDVLRLKAAEHEPGPVKSTVQA